MIWSTLHGSYQRCNNNFYSCLTFSLWEKDQSESTDYTQHKKHNEVNWYFQGAHETILSSTSKISSWLDGWINGLQNLWSCYWQEEPASVTDLLSSHNNLLQTGTCCNQSLAIGIIWAEITFTVWHIHQLLVGKGCNFSRMPCKAVRIESFFFVFLVCVKTQNTQTASPTPKTA